jgi:hypothetical protein
MCCYDAVYADRNTADALQQIAQARAVDFQECGVTLPSIVITAGVWRDAVDQASLANFEIVIEEDLNGSSRLALRAPG